MAIKVLSVELESMRGEREFISEIAALSDVHHENLVNLHGCCVEGAKRCLVYDYMENNSLSHRFLGNSFLFQFHPKLHIKLIQFNDKLILSFLDLSKVGSKIEIVLVGQKGRMFH